MANHNSNAQAINGGILEATREHTNNPDLTLVEARELLSQQIWEKVATKVYFIVAPSAMKIGISAEPRKRLKTIQTHNHEELSLVATILTPDAAILEKQLHKAFDDKHIRGEWFDIKFPDVLKWLRDEGIDVQYT